MARKSKRMMQTDAIRQGQAKIAEGLKTGQMRGDNPPAQADARNNRLNLDGVVPGKVSVSTSETRSTSDKVLTLKAKLVLLSCIGGLAVLIGFTVVLRDSGSTNPPVDVKVPGPGSEVSMPAEPAPQGKASPEKLPQKTEAMAPPVVVSAGNNVIWIKSIEISRQNELVPVREFFHRKGIPTEIIEAGDLAALVTKEGFEKNPAASGTDGYELLQRIKQLGQVYVEETQDTKFGVKPFQDAYGYKRQ